MHFLNSWKWIHKDTGTLVSSFQKSRNCGWDPMEKRRSEYRILSHLQWLSLNVPIWPIRIIWTKSWKSWKDTILEDLTSPRKIWGNFNDSQFSSRVILTCGSNLDSNKIVSFRDLSKHWKLSSVIKSFSKTSQWICHKTFVGQFHLDQIVRGYNLFKI